MLIALDVHYEGDGACAAGVLFESWDSPEAREERVCEIAAVAPYEPGDFYLRELPCLLEVLDGVDLDAIEAIIIDGYVWLDADDRAGLGAHLYEALDELVPVVGVAKNPFRDAESFAIPVLRGESERPLWVTAAGVDATTAAAHLPEMHGPYRFPTLLREVDSLCRGLSPSTSDTA